MFHVQGKLGRVVVAVALVMALSFAGSARADTPGRSGASSWWLWLDKLSQGRIGELVKGWTAGAPHTSTPAALPAKDGVCSPTNPSACSPPPPPPGGGQGPSLDPDGKP